MIRSVSRVAAAAGAGILLLASGTAVAQHSIARQWNDEMLDAIRRDEARPPIHARNLYHTSVAMWDIWAAYDTVADQVLIQERHTAADVQAAREEAISYATYRILTARFAESPGALQTLPALTQKMMDLGYDPDNTSTAGDSPSAFGNRVGALILAMTFADGGNESENYDNNIGYEPVNPPLVVGLPGNPDLLDPNKWQPLALDFFIDQSGINIGEYPDFLCPHWGQVANFALDTWSELADLPQPSNVWHDPGPPPYLGTATDQEYKDGFADVVFYGSFLDPDTSGTLDIGPASMGNNPLGTYDGTGYDINPHTGMPYAPNVVKHGDWGRCIAEFWADGPDSETPPGHWNVVANDVVEHPMFERRLGGTGAIVDALEYDVKLYLAMNGSQHDAAIAAWGLKGHYDYIRPISAIRYMAGMGQSSDELGVSYHPEGIPLMPNVIELITAESIAEGERHEHLVERIGDFIIDDHVGEIALNSWAEPEEGVPFGGTQWILAANWVPYQRPTFVTPPFAGYVSGHSTYSRAAAEIMAEITGDEYFPGGLGEYTFEQNNYLVFEEGPSETITVQWATYYDAADEAGLSRLYGGIHPPADDLPGRIIGSDIGKDAWRQATAIFEGRVSCPADLDQSRVVNILDLLVFIDGWLDNDEDFNGDDATSILDLLEYLEIWLVDSQGDGAC